jgi:hypothetical protein
MRAGPEGPVGRRAVSTKLERIVIANVYIAVITLMIWYVFSAGSPAPILCRGGCL